MNKTIEAGVAELLTMRFEAVLSPVMDMRAPYAKLMTERLVEAALAERREGYVLVPVEPTLEMKIAGGMIPDTFKGTSAAQGNADRIYRAMIAAALVKQKTPE